MDSPTITLLTKKGESMEFTVSKPTVLAKRTFFKHAQIYNEHLLRTAAAHAERDGILDKIKDKAITPEAREALITDAGKVFEKITELNDKAYDLNNRRVYDILVPADEKAKNVKFEVIDWDQADDNELEEIKGFFSESLTPKKKPSNDSEQTTSS